MNKEIVEKLKELNGFEDYHINFYKRIDPDEILKFEQLNRIRLPESYKHFISEYGLFTFRNETGWYKLLSFDEAMNIRERNLRNYNPEPKWEFRERFEQLVIFQNNGWGNTTFYAFDFYSTEENNQEALVISLDLEDAIEWNQTRVTFKEHIFRLVDAKLNGSSTFFF